MALSDILMGTAGSYKAMPTLTPEQQSLFGQLTGGLGAPLSSGLGHLQNILSGNLSAYEAPAMSQFQQEILPSIAERFTSGFGSGGLGAQQSSAFSQILGQAGSNLAERLAMQRQDLRSNALSQLQSLLGVGLSPTFQWQQTGGREGLAKPLMSLAGTLGGAYLGGPGGAAIGSKLGSTLGGMFKKKTPGPYGSYSLGAYNPYTDQTV